MMLGGGAMDLNHIRQFLTLAETLNFTEAAKIHETSQPTLSKAIQRIEDELGGQLIVRDGKNTRLSALGRKVRGEFIRIVELEARAFELVAEHERTGVSELNIGISTTLGPPRFTDFFASFLEQNENVEVILHQVDPETAPELILSGALDACIANREVPERPKIRVTPIFNERMRLAFGRTHRFARLDRVSMADLRNERYLDRINCDFRADIAAVLEAANVDLDVSLRSDREDWIQQFLADGVGVAIIPEFSTVTDGLILRDVEGIDFKRPVALLSAYGPGKSAAIAKIEALARTFPWTTNSRK